MTTSEIIQNVPEELFDSEGNTPETILLIRAGAVSAMPADYLSRSGDELYKYAKLNGSITLQSLPVSAFNPEFTSAEQWLIAQGYGPMQLVSLLDIESRLNAAARSAPKLQAVRQWIDAVTEAFLQSPEPRNNWPLAPHQFGQTLIEASQILAP